jgi:hypothetical protein
MKNVLMIIALFALAACNNSGQSTTSTDTTTKVNTESGNVQDGGPNNGMGDTTAAKMVPTDTNMKRSPGR